MTRDPRIHLDPTTRPYDERMAREQATAEASVSDASWAAILEPLAEVVLLVARGERATAPAFPLGGDGRLEMAFHHVAKRFLHEDDHQREALEVILERRLAQYVGTRVPDSALQWETIAAELHDWRAWLAFVEAVPIAVIHAQIHDLARMSTDLSTCIDGFGALRDNFDDALRTLDDMRQRERDNWRWLDTVERFADDARLAPNMSLRSELLARAGALPWLAWATRFPHPVLIACAVNGVDDLDFVEQLVASCHEAPGDSDPRRLTLLLLIRRCLQLWEHVDRSLERAATTTWGGADEDRAEYERMRADWLETEFPRRCAHVAATLVASSEGLNVAIVTARHLHAPRQASAAQGPAGTSMGFRDCLLRQLGQSDVDEMISQVLAPPMFSAGVLAGARLALGAPSANRLDSAFKAYSAWLGSDDFYWASPLDGHDREIVDTMAAVLAEGPRAVVAARGALAAARRPPQGWGFELDAWLRAVPGVAHVLIVIAAAAAHVHSRGNVQEACDLMDLAWSELELLLRGSPVSTSDGHVASAVAYVWAHASRMFQQADPRMSAAIERFDDVRLMILAAQNFKMNSGTLPAAVQHALRRAFDAHLPILERHPHVSAESLEELRCQVIDLTR